MRRTVGIWAPKAAHRAQLFDLLRDLCILPRDGIFEPCLVDALCRDVRVALLPLLHPSEGLRCRPVKRPASSFFPVPKEAPLLPPLCGPFPVHNWIHHPVRVVPPGRLRREGGRHLDPVLPPPPLLPNSFLRCDQQLSVCPPPPVATAQRLSVSVAALSLSL